MFISVFHQQCPEMHQEEEKWTQPKKNKRIICTYLLSSNIILAIFVVGRKLKWPWEKWESQKIKYDTGPNDEDEVIIILHEFSPGSCSFFTLIKLYFFIVVKLTPLKIQLNWLEKYDLFASHILNN